MQEEASKVLSRIEHPLGSMEGKLQRYLIAVRIEDHNLIQTCSLLFELVEYLAAKEEVNLGAVVAALKSVPAFDFLIAGRKRLVLMR